jgi:hypothetical protein
VSLRFDQTVPRQLAHRRALGEVFVADSAQVADDAYVLALQVPRAHSLWFDRRSDYHDPLSLVEATRQASFVIVHRHLGVPVGLPFTLQSVCFRTDDLGCFVDSRRAPLEGVLSLRVVQRREAGSLQGSLRLAGSVEVGGAQAMTMEGEIVFMSSADYEALRAYQRRRKPLGGDPSPAVQGLAPADVGRADPRNVVVGEPAQTAGGLSFPLVVDRTHPSFFDHDFDHVPGPLLGEAFRQAAIVTAYRAGELAVPEAIVTACEAAFSDFAELDAPVQITVSPRRGQATRRLELDVEVRQLDRRIAEASITLRAYPDDPA